MEAAIPMTLSNDSYSEMEKMTKLDGERISCARIRLLVSQELREKTEHVNSMIELYEN